ncbi:MAG: hypothetical protein FWD62_12815 [Betaproteobacteria bacterium]|nr:hypothetical protein [Betaproteobacteria bacterium]
MFKHLRILALAALVLLTGCGEKSAPSEAPANFSVTPGDSQVVLHFTQEPGMTYWLFYAPATGINRDNYLSYTGAQLIRDVYDGGAIAGLANGQIYSFFMNASNGSGPAGPTTATISVTPRPAGGSWVANPIIGNGANANAVTFGLSHFVTVTTGGGIYYSDDGQNWTASDNAGTSANLNGVTLGSNATVMVAVGDAGTLLSSTDALTWTPHASGTSANLNSVAAFGGTYIAVGEGGTILYSTDGTTWSARTSPVMENLRKVVYVRDDFVAVGDNGTVLTSPDGNAWTKQNSGTGATLYDVAYGNNTFVGVGAAGTLMTSPDLVTWTPLALDPSITLYAATFGSQFIAVGQNGTTLVSPDGVSWNFVASATSADLYAIVFGSGTYLAVGQNGASQYSN